MSKKRFQVGDAVVIDDDLKGRLRDAKGRPMHSRDEKGEPVLLLPDFHWVKAIMPDGYLVLEPSPRCVVYPDELRDVIPALPSSLYSPDPVLVKDDLSNTFIWRDGKLLFHRPDLRVTLDEAMGISIRKWSAIAEQFHAGKLVRSEGGRDTCMLCSMFWHRHCDQCPVKWETGCEDCVGSPYDDYARIEEDGDGATREEKCQRLMKKAESELRFLKRLRRRLRETQRKMETTRDRKRKATTRRKSKPTRRPKTKPTRRLKTKPRRRPKTKPRR